MTDRTQAAIVSGTDLAGAGSPGRAARSRWRTGVTVGEGVVGSWLVIVAAMSDVAPSGQVMLAGLVVAITVAALVVARRPVGVVSGMSMVLMGMLGACAGGGIGLSWLATTGPSAVAMLGVASLGAGSLLLGVGTWTALRATPGWWRLLAIPVGFLLLQFGVLPLGMAFYGTHPPRTPVSTAMPESARRVALRTPDDVELVAWYTPSSNGAAVIVLAGSGGDKGSTVAHAAILARHGYGTLALDSRGTGDSGGTGNAWGWHGPDDIAGALDWLTARPEVDPRRIAAVGLSMGGEEALTAAALDPRVAAVVAEGATGRTPDDLAYLPGDLVGAIERLEALVMYGAADLMTDAHLPLALRTAVADAAVPMLLIVGSDPDEAAAADVFEAASPALERWDLFDTPHIGALTVHPADWEDRVIGFLDDALDPGHRRIEPSRT